MNSASHSPAGLSRFVWLFSAVIFLFAISASAQTVINITSSPYNASTSSSDNASAIQSAINACPSGGTVLVPSGTFLSGPLTLKSNMTFQIASGATLKMTPMGTFPASSDFLYGSGLSNLTINGSGTMDGQGAAWWSAFNSNSSTVRPAAMIEITKSSNVTLMGITVKDSPKFHIQTLGSMNGVYCSGLSITAAWPSPNTDGIDLRGQNYLIENCYISDGDDVIQIGGSSDNCQAITIRNCTFGTGHGLSIGGYTQGGVSNVLVDSCTFNGTQYGIRWKSGRDRGGMVTNLTYQNITMTGILNYPFYLTSWYPNSLPPSSDTTASITSTTPYWENITLRNITASTASGAKGPGIFWAVPEAPVTNFLFDGVTVTGPNGVTMDIHHARAVTFTCTNRVDGAQPPTNIGSFDAVISYPSCGSNPTPTFTSSAPTATKTSTPVPPTATFTTVPPTDTFTSTATRTNTPVPPTATETFTSTHTNTPIPPTATPTFTATKTNTPVPPTRTMTPTNTAIVTATNTSIPPTATFTAVPPTATHTSTPVPPTTTFTNSPVPPTATNTSVSSTSTSTPVPPTATFTGVPATATFTNSPVPPTFTGTPVPPTATNTALPPTATFTNSPVPATATGTPVPPTVTSTPVPPTSTNTPMPSTATNTPVPPTSTFTAVPPTATRTNTAVPPTSTNTPVPPTNTATNTPVPPTATHTHTPVPSTATFTPVPPTATPTTPAPSSSFKVQLLSGVTGNTTNSPHPFLQVVNTGSGLLNLNNVTVRYWFNCDCTTQTLQAWVDWAGLMPSGTSVTGNVVPSIHSTSLGGQTDYVLYSFTGNMVLQPGQYINVQSRFNKSDWSNMTQSNDWSFKPNTSYIDDLQVTGYLGGNLVWGEQPVGSSAALTASSAMVFPNPSTGNGSTLSFTLGGNSTGASASVLDDNHFLMSDPAAKITLGIYTLSGRLIWSEELQGGAYGTTGEHQLYWNEKDFKGAGLANGLYYLKVTVQSNGQTTSTMAKILITG